MTGSWFVVVAPWPRDERKIIPSFVRGELSFTKQGSVLVSFSGAFVKANKTKLLQFLVNLVMLYTTYSI